MLMSLAYHVLTLNLKGSEIINILNVEKGLKPREEVTLEFLFEDGSSKKINGRSKIFKNKQRKLENIQQS